MGVPVGINFNVESFIPQNAGEYATYVFKIQTEYEITKNSNQSIVFKFPKQYADILIDKDLVLVCSSDPASGTCTSNYNGEVTFSNFL
jgi:hypothetical protein